jgi:hypothetical protein
LQLDNAHQLNWRCDHAPASQPCRERLHDIYNIQAHAPELSKQIITHHFYATTVARISHDRRPSEALASSSSAASAGANGCRSSEVGGFLRMILVKIVLIMSEKCEKCDIPEL